MADKDFNKMRKWEAMQKGKYSFTKIGESGFSVCIRKILIRKGRQERDCLS